MHIILTGDQFSPCHWLAQTMLRRLLNRYSPDIVIIHGSDTGVDETVKLVAKCMRLKTEKHLVDSGHLMPIGSGIARCPGPAPDYVSSCTARYSMRGQGIWH